MVSFLTEESSSVGVVMNNAHYLNAFQYLTTDDKFALVKINLTK